MKFDTVDAVLSVCRAWSLLLAGLVVAGVVCAQVAVPAGSGWTLAAALQRAQEANRDVLMARRAVDGAQADVQTASVTPAPQLSLLSQAINTQNLGHGSAWSRPVDTILRLDTTMERGGKRAQRERQAQAGLLASQWDQAQALRAQQVAVAQAYWDLKLAQVQHETAALDARVAEEGRQVAQLRLKNGDLSSLEATRLSLEADRALNETDQTLAQLSQAQWALAQLLALDQQPELQALDPWPTSQPLPQLAETPADAEDASWLVSRADVQAARQRLAQADAALALVQAQRTSDVTWSVQFEHNPPAGSHLWGVGVAFPLGMDARQDGPERRALVAQADAQALLDKTQADAVAERARLKASLAAAARRIERFDAQLLPQAKEAVKAAEFARQQGALSLQDVLDTRRLAHAAELDAAQAHADHAKALAALTLPFLPSVVNP